MLKTVATFPLFAVCVIIAFIGACCGFVYTMFMSGALLGNLWAARFAHHVRDVDEEVVDRTPYAVEEHNRRIKEKAEKLGWPWCPACEAYHHPRNPNCPDYDWNSHDIKQGPGTKQEPPTSN